MPRDMPLKLVQYNELESIFSVSNDLSLRLGSTNDHLKLYFSFWCLNQCWLLLLCYGKRMLYHFAVFVFVQHIHRSLHDCWRRPVSLFSLLCFKPFSPASSCSSCHNKIILPSPIRWRHLSSIIICGSWLRNRQQEGTRGAASLVPSAIAN